MVATAVVSQPIAPIRRDTPERWERALERAQVANVVVTLFDEWGTYKVTSASFPGIEYESDGIHCTCQAAANHDPVCLHRAAVRAHLASPEPEPPAQSPSQIALMIARNYLAETTRICAERTDDDRAAIRRTYGIPDTCTASPERIAELKARLDASMDQIGAAVRELEAAGYFESTEKVSA